MWPVKGRAMANYLDSSGLQHLWGKIKALVADKAAVGHTHDDRYYTEEEADAKLLGVFAYVDGKAPLTALIEKGDSGYTSSHSAKELYEAMSRGTPVFASAFGYILPAFGSGFNSAAQQYQIQFSSTGFNPAGFVKVEVFIETTRNVTTVTAKMGQVLKTRSVTLPAAGWDAAAKTQTVTVSGVSVGSAVTPSPAPESWEAAGAAGVRCTAQAANSLTFACTTVPTVDLSYNVLIQEVI